MNKKKIIKVMVIVLLVLAVLFGIFTTVSYLSLKKNIVGVWSREAYHNSTENVDIGIIRVIDANGTYEGISYNIDTDKIRGNEEGTWEITPFSVIFKESGEHGEMVCKYNLFTKTFSNNSLEYTKIEE